MNMENVFLQNELFLFIRFLISHYKIFSSCVFLHPVCFYATPPANYQTDEFISQVVHFKERKRIKQVF